MSVDEPNPSPSEPRRRRRRGEITRAAVLDAALAVVDTAGIDALTMRRIADVLDASPMSLYNHVRTKEELIEELVGVAWQVLDTPAELTGDWDQQLTQFLRNMHQTMLDRPGLVQILLSHPSTGLGVYRSVERLLNILRTAGFTTEQTVAAMATLESFTFGFTIQQRLRNAQIPDQELARMRALPPEEFPRLVEMAESVSFWATEDQFEAGLDRLIEQLRQDLQPITTRIPK